MWWRVTLFPLSREENENDENAFKIYDNGTGKATRFAGMKPLKRYKYIYLCIRMEWCLMP